jgi:hypothetical protein
MIPFLPTLARYRRFVAIGLGAMAAGIVMPFMRTREVIHVPGIPEPYEIGVADPFVATALAYLVVSFLARRFFDWIVLKTRTVLNGR